MMNIDQCRSLYTRHLIGARCRGAGKDCCRPPQLLAPMVRLQSSLKPHHLCVF